MYLAALAVVSTTDTVLAGSINSDVALTPPRGGSIFRLQYFYTEADGPSVEQVNSSTVKGTYVYGFTEKLSFFLTVPYVNRQVDIVIPRFGRVEEAHDGIADVTVLAKYRFWQDDRRPLETLRWALLGGLNIRSGDSAFTSDSYDPIIGTAFTWQRDRTEFDADLVYQFNTGRDEFRHDALRYDMSFSYRLFPSTFAPDSTYEFDLVGELNGRYMTDGSHELFLSPGLQFITERWIIEAAVQLPVIQEFADNRAETDYRVVVGFRFQW